MCRLGLDDILVTHGNRKGFGLASLSAARSGYLPPQLKQKQNRILRQIHLAQCAPISQVGNHFLQLLLRGINLVCHCVGQTSKGQLISKCLFGVFNSTKK